MEATVTAGGDGGGGGGGQVVGRREARVVVSKWWRRPACHCPHHRKRPTSLPTKRTNMQAQDGGVTPMPYNTPLTQIHTHTYTYIHTQTNTYTHIHKCIHTLRVFPLKVQPRCMLFENS